MNTCRIGMVGTFDVPNFGDRLFPLVARHELERRLGPVEIRAFSYHARSAPWPFPVTPLDQLATALGSLDLLIVGGGDIIRFDPLVALDYRPDSPWIHHPTGFWLAPILMAHVANVPVAWNAPGLPAPVPPWARALVRASVAVSTYVSVRDTASRDLLAAVVADTPIEVVPDSGFNAACLLGDGEAGAGRHSSDVIPALNGTDSYVVVQNRPDAPRWLPHVRQLLRVAGLRFVLTPVGPATGDPLAPPRRLPPDTIFAPRLDPREMVALIAGSMGVVGPSLHLTIAALSTGRPAFRPKAAALRKYGVLEGLQGICHFEPGVPAALDVEHATLAPAPSQAVAMQERLARHWDTVASLARSTSGPRSPQAAWEPRLMDLWQRLPSTLAQQTAWSRAHNAMRVARGRLSRRWYNRGRGA